MSLHELAHVALAAEPAGEDALAIALLAKLGRVFLLIPVSFVFIYIMKRKNKNNAETTKVEFPYFLLGFILLSFLGSYVFGNIISLPTGTLDVVANITTWLLTAAMVGLGLNPSVIKAHGKVALVAGILQIATTAFLGYGVSWLMGIDTQTSMYIGAAMTFSSTIVIIKLLSDKDDVDSLYGRIATGILIIQDIAAMVLLMAVSLGNQA